MKRRLGQLLFVLLLVALGGGGAHLLTRTAQTADVDLAQSGVVDKLGFMTGTWRGTFRGLPIDEIWLAPRDGSMAGTYRIVPENGAPKLYFMIVAQEDEGVFFRFNSFDPDYTNINDRPSHFRLVELEPTRAVFRNENAADAMTGLVYDRRSEGHLMVQILQRTADGEHEVIEFPMFSTDD